MLPKRRRPTHPGKILEEEFLKPLSMTPRKLAETLGGNWNEVKVEAIIHGKENINESAALALSKALGTSLEFWTHLQGMYNQWEKTHRANEKGSPKPWKKAQ